MMLDRYLVKRMFYHDFSDGYVNAFISIGMHNPDKPTGLLIRPVYKIYVQSGLVLVSDMTSDITQWEYWVSNKPKRLNRNGIGYVLRGLYPNEFK